MREPIRNRERLLHIIMAIDNVFEFATGYTADNVFADKRNYYAIVKNIEIIGEAAYKLTSDFRDSHPATEWRDIIDLRHVLVHGYYQISNSELWNIIMQDLHPLRSQIEEYLKGFAPS